MAILGIRDAANLIKYLEMEGIGSDSDPFRPVQSVYVTPAATFYTGQLRVASAGAIVRLPAFPLTTGVLLKALSDNQGSIFLGGATVTASSGYELDKNESILIRIDELSKLYITSSSNNEGICAIGV